MSLAPYRKALAAVAGLIAQAVAAGLVPDRWLPYAQIVLAALTALGVYRVPNAPKQPKV